MINIEEIRNNEFNLNAKEALKLMLEGKAVISINGGMFFYHKNLDKIILNKNGTFNVIYEDIFLSYMTPKYKEYIEPKKTNKIITFNTYIGENTVCKPFKKCPIERAFGHEVSRLCDDLNALKSVYEKVSKVKVTIEIIEENI